MNNSLAEFVRYRFYGFFFDFGRSIGVIMQLVRFLFLVPLLLSFLLSPFSIAPPTAHAAQADTCVSKWMTVAMPVPPTGYPVLRRASSSASDNVWAVGFFWNNGDTPSKTLIEHWDGNAWAIAPSPNVDGYSNRLVDVAVVGASDAWAVGSSTAGYISHLLMQRWDGHTWTIVPLLNGQADTGELVSISGIAANDVWAAGTLSGNALILHWNGSEWQSVPSPINLSFTRVIAKAANDVWALGVDADHNATILHWDGSAWTITTSFELLYDYRDGNPYFHVEGLSDFVVPAANDIWVEGYYLDHYSSTLRLWHWDGTRWDSSGSAAGKPIGGASQSIAGPSGDNLWIYFETSLNGNSRTLGHRNSTGWHYYQVPGPWDSLLYASISAVSNEEFWIVGASGGLEPVALHGIFSCHEPPADKATLISPAQGEITTELRMTFEWEDVGGTSYYNLEVTHPYNDPTVIERLPNSEYFWYSPGMPNGEHSWRVQACNYVGCGPWSDPVTWTNQTPAPVTAPQLLSPPSGTSIASDRVTVRWALVSNTAFYEAELYKGAPVGPAYDSYRAFDDVEDYWFLRGLGEGHYYWRVRACNPGGCGPWSGKFEFTIFYPPPPRPVLLIPGPKNVVNMRKPNFGWESSGDDARYTLELRSRSKNGAIIDTKEVGSAVSWRWPRILPNGQYYWRVKACNDHHCSEWSKGRKFFVQK